MKAAEAAALRIGMALESVGVNVMMVGLHGNKARAEKPFGTSFDQRVGAVCNADTAGGTPLTQVLDLSRERLKGQQGQKAVMVVTDGKPSDSSAYGDAIDRCSFPVIGVQLRNGDGGAGEDFYHRYVTAKPGDADELEARLRELVQEAMDL